MKIEEALATAEEILHSQGVLSSTEEDICENIRTALSQVTLARIRAEKQEDERKMRS